MWIHLVVIFCPSWTTAVSDARPASPSRSARRELSPSCESLGQPKVPEVAEFRKPIEEAEKQQKTKP